MHSFSPVDQQIHLFRSSSFSYPLFVMSTCKLLRLLKFRRGSWAFTFSDEGEADRLGVRPTWPTIYILYLGGREPVLWLCLSPGLTPSISLCRGSLFCSPWYRPWTFFFLWWLAVPPSPEHLYQSSFVLRVELFPTARCTVRVCCKIEGTKMWGFKRFVFNSYPLDRALRMSHLFKHACPNGW